MGGVLEEEAGRARFDGRWDVFVDVEGSQDDDPTRLPRAASRLVAVSPSVCGI